MWYESEDFWTNYGPIMFDEARWKEAPDVAEYVKKIAGLKDGDKVLDAGCGVGRISVELAALGLDVTGIDIIQNELDAAKESAEAEGVELHLIKQDLRNFNEENKYNCAVNLFTSFGYCDTKKDDLLILKNICRSLKKGGTFILECLSRETEILYFTPGETFERAGYLVKTEFSVTGLWEGLRSKWTLTKLPENNNSLPENDKNSSSSNCKQETIEHEFIQRLYSGTEMRQCLLDAGFSTAEIYGDFDKSPYDQNARTMVAIAVK